MDEVALSGAVLSSVADASLTGGAFLATNVIDGNLNTLCASALEDNPWVSVRMPAGATDR